MAPDRHSMTGTSNARSPHTGLRSRMGRMSCVGRMSCSDSRMTLLRRHMLLHRNRAERPRAHHPEQQNHSRDKPYDLASYQTLHSNKTSG